MERRHLFRTLLDRKDPTPDHMWPTQPLPDHYLFPVQREFLQAERSWKIWQAEPWVLFLELLPPQNKEVELFKEHIMQWTETCPLEDPWNNNLTSTVDIREERIRMAAGQT